MYWQQGVQPGFLFSTLHSTQSSPFQYKSVTVQSSYKTLFQKFNISFIHFCSQKVGILHLENSSYMYIPLFPLTKKEIFFIFQQK